MNWGINPLRALKKHPNMYARAVIMKPMNNIHISNTKIVVTIELYSGYPFALYMVGWVASKLTHAKPIKLPYSVGWGFG
jgi:hypothetical protein